MHPFQALGIREELLRAVAELGFEQPTPVQELVIPHALTSESDILALAQTGTGKTAAFGLPLLQLIDPNVQQVQALVLCPTRELCVQVSSDLKNYAKHLAEYNVVSVYGGAPIDRQMRQIKAGAQIVVATPGRLIDLLERNAVDLSHIQRLVLDEADEMLNMGFREAIDTILASTSDSNTTWLFSATMSHDVRRIANSYMTKPLELSVGQRNQGNENIDHIYYMCRTEDRYLTLKRVVDANPGIYGLIFCRTKIETKEIADLMTKDGYNSDALHGDLQQAERDRVMRRFRDGTLQLLIATDVAARGIDVSDITHVIHYGLPDDTESYTHRSGRTGRAGKKGVSMAIVTTKFQHKVREIERMIKATIKKKEIPSAQEVCEAQLMHIMGGIRNIPVNEKALAPFLPQIYESLEDLTKEEIIQRFASVEFNRFIDYYKDAPDLNERLVQMRKPFERKTGMGGESRSFGGGNNGKFQRMFINIGEMDGVSRRDFLDMITGDMKIPSRAVGTIDINRAYMHFDLDGDFVETFSQEAKTMVVNGRKVKVDIATPRTGGGDRERSGGSRFSKDKPFGRDREKTPGDWYPREKKGQGGFGAKKGRDRK